jgi:hypothetical protein
MGSRASAQTTSAFVAAACSLSAREHFTLKGVGFVGAARRHAPADVEQDERLAADVLDDQLGGAALTLEQVPAQLAESCSDPGLGPRRIG